MSATREDEVPVNRAKHGGRTQPKASPPPSIPRIARLMALAIKFQDMVDRGEVCDYADPARLGFFTPARLTQIMNLLLLAPDIQEVLLNSSAKLERPLPERHIRSIAAVELWESQRAAMVRLGCRGNERGM